MIAETAALQNHTAETSLGVKLLGKIEIRQINIDKSHSARNIRGVKRNYLKALCPTGFRSANSIAWLCICDCGQEVIVAANRLLSDQVKSCGCKTKELIGKRLRRHGMSHSPTWRSWKSMLDRCYLVAHKSYKYYGGRGIEVCDRWHAFENFLADMGERPDGLTIERVENGGDYEPGNCRWASRQEQANNRRSSATMEFNGETMTMAQWSERVGIGQDTLTRRIKLGWSVKDVLTRPLKQQKNSRSNRNIPARTAEYSRASAGKDGEA